MLGPRPPATNVRRRPQLPAAEIARCLTATALGQAYYGDALDDATRLPILTDDERFVLYRWLDGSQVSNDTRELQMIAMRISCDA
jgi:hypothetical protein